MTRKTVFNGCRQEKKRRRFFLIPAVLLSMSFAVSAQRVEVPPQPGQEEKPIVSAPAGKDVKSKRIREGTACSGKKVFFRTAGDRTVLYTVEDNQRYTCLENLTLERVLTAIKEKPEHKIWKIEGEFTEFRGENYVLLRRATVSK
ncbi:MAG: hypothetical protein LBH00_09500 [Planctomycetaceae bacterium]|jgi:hypothetical protein|nr:hypothetical protein [Planctomycetaceae bacterium]